jgi:hypothetical protein
MLSAALLFASTVVVTLESRPPVAPDTLMLEQRRAVASDTTVIASVGAIDTVVARKMNPVWTWPVDTPAVRRRTVEYSDWYARRLAIHRVGSYTMLPLFGAEYVLGDRLLNGTNFASWVKPAHLTVATGLGALFTINTVTGVWNLWDSRHDPAGRTRRWLHAGLMLASDAGFVWTGTLADGAGHSPSDARLHRNAAIGSMAISAAGTALMWLWKD